MSGASFRKIRFFGPGRRLAASEGPKIAQIGSLARMKNDRFPAIRRRRVFRVLGPPRRPRWQRPILGLSGLVSIGFLASWGSRDSQEPPGMLREAQGSPGRPRTSSEMSGASFRKILFFGPGRRLAASEGPKIAQIGSLARMKKGYSRPSEGGRVLRLLGRPQALEEVRCVAATFSRLVAIAFLAQNGSSGDGVNFFGWSSARRVC